MDTVVGYTNNVNHRGIASAICWGIKWGSSWQMLGIPPIYSIFVCETTMNQPWFFGRPFFRHSQLGVEPKNCKFNGTIYEKPMNSLKNAKSLQIPGSGCLSFNVLCGKAGLLEIWIIQPTCAWICFSAMSHEASEGSSSWKEETWSKPWKWYDCWRQGNP